MPYLIVCKDKQDSLLLRKKNREKHLKYLERFKSKLIMAGPILSNSGNPEGTVIVLNYDNRENIDKFINEDPYNLVSLFEKVSIHKFKKVF